MEREGNICKVDLSRAMKAQRGEKTYSSFFNLVSRWRLTPRSGCFTPGNDSVPIV